MYNQYNLEANRYPELLIISFRQFLIAEKIAKGTIRSYVSDVRSFFNWLVEFLINGRVFEANSPLASNPVYLFSLINERVLSSYEVYLRNKNVPLKTINRRYSALRKLGSFSVSQSIIAENVFESLKTMNDSVPFPESEYHLEEFKTLLWQNGLTKSTMKNYLGDVRQYLQCIVGVQFIEPAIHKTGAMNCAPTGQNVCNPKLNNFQQLNQYLDHLINKGVSPATVKRKESSVGAYLSFLEGKQSTPLINKTVDNENINADFIKRLAALGIQAEIKQIPLTPLSSRAQSRDPFPPQVERKGFLHALAFSSFGRNDNSSKWLAFYQKSSVGRFVNFSLLTIFIFILGIGVYVQFGQKEGHVLGSTIISPLSSKDDSRGLPAPACRQGKDFRGSFTGTAIIPSGSTETKIVTPYVTKNSLVYLTSIGSTDNQVLYIKELNYIEKTITIGFDQEMGKDLKFNWWIVN